METPEKLPGDFTMVVPLNRSRTKTATFYLRDIDETTYTVTRKLLDERKELEAVMVMIKSLKVGGDEIDLIKDNFIAKQSASYLLAEIMEPVKGDLKKN